LLVAGSLPDVIPALEGIDDGLSAPGDGFPEQLSLRRPFLRPLLRFDETSLGKGHDAVMTLD